MNMLNILLGRILVYELIKLRIILSQRCKFIIDRKTFSIETY